MLYMNRQCREENYLKNNRVSEWGERLSLEKVKRSYIIIIIIIIRMIIVCM